MFSSFPKSQDYSDIQIGVCHLLSIMKPSSYYRLLVLAVHKLAAAQERLHFKCTSLAVKHLVPSKKDALF